MNIDIKNIPLFLCFLFLGTFTSIGFCSCSMLGFPSGRSWSPFSGKGRGFAELGTVRVDKNADWDSVDAETRRLLLLLLSEAGFKQGTQLQLSTAAGDLTEQKPFYKVDAVLIEREYMENWKTRRSLSVEILFFIN
jgi:hypothetical protein